MNEPWFRESRQCWFVTSGGKQIRLDSDKDKAYQIWHELCAKSERKKEKNPTLRELVSEFFEFAARQVRNGELKAKTLNDYLWYIDQFLVVYGDYQVLTIEPHHLTDWLNSKRSWGSAGQRGAITAIKRVFSWGLKERRIQQDNLAYVKKPPQQRREKLIDPDEHHSMIMEVRNGGFASATDKQFQLVLIAIRHTGGRPQDVANVRVEHVSNDFTDWTIPDHKRRQHTSQPKVVFLSPCLQTITRILCDGRHRGPLFQSRTGALTVNAIGCRIKRLKQKLKLDSELVAYSYRHTYITDCLQNGIDIATVAELVGTSVQMIERHYGHLAKRRSHLANAALTVMRHRYDGTD